MLASQITRTCWTLYHINFGVIDIHSPHGFMMFGGHCVTVFENAQMHARHWSHTRRSYKGLPQQPQNTSPALSCQIHIRDHTFNGNPPQVLTQAPPRAVHTVCSSDAAEDATRSSKSVGLSRSRAWLGHSWDARLPRLLSVPSWTTDTRRQDFTSGEGKPFVTLGAGPWRDFQRQTCSPLAWGSVSTGALPLLGLHIRRGVTGRSPISGFFLLFLFLHKMWGSFREGLAGGSEDGGQPPPSFNKQGLKVWRKWMGSLSSQMPGCRGRIHFELINQEPYRHWHLFLRLLEISFFELLFSFPFLFFCYFQLLENTFVVFHQCCANNFTHDLF